MDWTAVAAVTGIVGVISVAIRSAIQAGEYKNRITNMETDLSEFKQETRESLRDLKADIKSGHDRLRHDFNTLQQSVSGIAEEFHEERGRNSERHVQNLRLLETIARQIGDRP